MKGFPDVTPKQVKMGGGRTVEKYEARFRYVGGYTYLGIHQTPQEAQQVVDEYRQTGKRPEPRRRGPQRTREYVDNILVLHKKTGIRYQVGEGIGYRGRFTTLEAARRVA